MEDLPSLDYQSLVATRDFLQDIAKLVGKLQQLFLPYNRHDWHRGLEVTAAGLMSQPFVVKGQTVQALIDFNLGCLELDKTSWELKHITAMQLHQELQYWLQARGLDLMLELPDLVTREPSLDMDQAKALAVALNWAEDQLEAVKRQINSGKSSPVLLYPHHFDLALSWFPQANDNQLLLGFSTGDKDINEPYFYLGAYPEPAGFKDSAWPAPAYWNSQGFNAAVLKYNDLRAAPEPAQVVAKLWQTASKLTSAWTS